MATSLDLFMDDSLDLEEISQLLELSDATVRGLNRIGISGGWYGWYGKTDNVGRLYCVLARRDSKDQPIVYYGQSQLLELEANVLESDIVSGDRRTPPIPLKSRE